MLVRNSCCLSLVGENFATLFNLACLPFLFIPEEMYIPLSRFSLASRLWLWHTSWTFLWRGMSFSFSLDGSYGIIPWVSFVCQYTFFYVGDTLSFPGSLSFWPLPLSLSRRTLLLPWVSSDLRSWAVPGWGLLPCRGSFLFTSCPGSPGPGLSATLVTWWPCSDIFPWIGGPSPSPGPSFSIPSILPLPAISSPETFLTTPSPGYARLNSMAFVTSQLETLGMIEQPVWL